MFEQHLLCCSEEVGVAQIRGKIVVIIVMFSEMQHCLIPALFLKENT